MRADDLLILQMMRVNPYNPIVFKLIQNRQSLNSNKITLKNTEKSGYNSIQSRNFQQNFIDLSYGGKLKTIWIEFSVAILS